MSVRLTTRPLSVASAMRELEGPGLGGIVVFAGRVRPDATREGRVVALVYETHAAPAARALRKLADTARGRFGAERTVLWHRFGRLQVGEISVIAGAACGHRAEAFEAARYLIEELKVSVPIWKTVRERPAHRPRRRPSRPGARSTG